MLHWLYTSWFGSRLLLLTIGLFVVTQICKRSYVAAKIIGNISLWVGILTTFGSVYGCVTHFNDTVSSPIFWMGCAIFGLVPAFFGRTILDNYGQVPPQQFYPQPEMPVMLPKSPHMVVGRITANALNEKWGGQKNRRSLDDQKEYD